MEKNGNKKAERDERINELNNIFEELITDGRELAKDLISGITQTFVAGVIAVIFGVQTAYYNRHYIVQGDLIPLLLAAATIFVGLIIVLRGFILRKKYARLSETYRELRTL